MLPDQTKLPFFPEGAHWYKGQEGMSQLRRLLHVAHHNYGNLIYGVYRRDVLLIRNDETVLSRTNSGNEIPLFLHVAAQGSIVVIPRVLMYKTTSLPTYVQAAWEYGVTPLVWRTQWRMSQVMEQITGTRLRIKEIAAATGFTHVSHLTRVFRRVYGISPAEAVKQFRRGGVG